MYLVHTDWNNLMDSKDKEEEDMDPVTTVAEAEAYWEGYNMIL